MADPKAIMDQMSNTTDPAKRKALEEQYRAAQKENALSAEGEMYAGKNNDAAMRKGEAARAGMAQAKAAAGSSKRRPDDFPIGFYDQIKALAGENSTQDEVYTWWEANKAKVKLNPSQEKFKGPKPKTIPQAVESL